MRPVETHPSRDLKILQDGHGSVSRGLTPRPATGAHEGARLQAQHCKPILPPGRVSKPSIVSLSCPRDGCPSTVSLSCAPPQLNRSCISSLSDSDRLENNFDLVEVGGPRLRASGLGHLAGLSIHRLQEAPHRLGGPRSHFASRPPSARMSCATRAGSSLQRLSTSWVALTSATAAFSRVRYSSGVSSQGRAGKERTNLY